MFPDEHALDFGLLQNIDAGCHVDLNQPARRVREPDVNIHLDCRVLDRIVSNLRLLRNFWRVKHVKLLANQGYEDDETADRGEAANNCWFDRLG